MKLDRNILHIVLTKNRRSIRSVDNKFTVISSKILKILNYENDLVTTKCMHINNGENLPLAVDSDLTDRKVHRFCELF
jgi:hypothetical protein